METLVYIITGVIGGMYIAYVQFKIKLLEKQLDAVVDEIPTAESLAKEILAIKMPISDLPKDTVDMINNEKNKSRDNNYFG